MTHLVLLNGASGVGKTTTAQRLTEISPSFGFVHPDELWQTPDMEAEEILRLAAIEVANHSAKWVVVDAQIRPTRVGDILAPILPSWTMFLLDCPDEIRQRRLLDRGWSEENFERLARWQSLLRSEMLDMHQSVLDTSKTSVDDCATLILQHLFKGK